MIIDLSREATRAEFGRVVGLSAAAVTKLVNSGLLATGASLGTWLTSYTDHLRQEAAGRAESPKLTAARARTEAARAERYELELRRAKSELVDRVDVERAVAARYVVLRDQYEAFPDRAIPRLGGVLGVTDHALLGAAHEVLVAEMAALAREVAGIDVKRMLDDPVPVRDVDLRARDLPRNQGQRSKRRPTRSKR